MTRPPWKRLTPTQQKAIAKDAAIIGLHRAAHLHNVSPPAARRACAMMGIIPKRYEMAMSKEARIATARALLRSLKLEPQDLLSTKSTMSTHT